MASQRGRDRDRGRDAAAPRRDGDRHGTDGTADAGGNANAKAKPASVGARARDAGASGRASPAPAPAVEVEGLTKRFGDGEDAVVAVDDVSFAIEPGSVVGLLGPNGAGKTTTIKCVLGTVVPDAGTVRVAGIDVHANPRAAYRHVDAMLEGARNDYWRLTVRENLRYFATVGGVRPGDVADRHDALLDQLDLAEFADTPVRDLSRGMKQKVSLASVLATDADVVFLDEPTLGLDVESSLTLRRELRRIVAERGLTVVLSSHDMRVVEDVCDRVIVVDDGRIVADDAVDGLLGGLEARGFRVASPDLDPGGDALAAVRDGFDVVDVRRDAGAGRTRVEVAAGPDDFYDLADLLRAHEVRVSSVETVEPDLESAFLQVTGEDAGAPGSGDRDDPATRRRAAVRDGDGDGDGDEDGEGGR